MHDDTLPKLDQPMGGLIQDEPLLTYQAWSQDNDDPLVALMPRLPNGGNPALPVLQALLFDAQQYNSALHRAEVNQPTIPTELPQAKAPPNPPASAQIDDDLHINQSGRDPAHIRTTELAMVERAAMEPQMQIWCNSYPDRHIEEKIRAVAAVIVAEKGYFGLGMDEQSMLLYDIRFLLASHHHLITDGDSWLRQHQPPAQKSKDYFYPVEHNLDLAELWLYKRLADGDIIETMSGLKPSPEFAQTVQQVLTAYTWS